MTNQGKKKLAAEQFDRACSLRRYLEMRCSGSSVENINRLDDSATDAIRNWLVREYNLGRACEKREQRKR